MKIKIINPNTTASMTEKIGIVAQALDARVIDGVGAAVKFVEVLVSLGLETSKVNSLAFPIPKHKLLDANRFLRRVSVS